MSARRSRREPPKRAGKVTGRDPLICAEVGRMRTASTRQIAALFFGELSTCSRRLAVLVGMGLLHVVVRDLSQPNIYTLSQKGLELLTREGFEPDEFFVARIDRRTALDHTLAIGDLRVAIQLELRERRLTVDRILQDHEIARLVGTATMPLVPDLFVARRAREDQTHAVLFEIDLAEESIPFFGRTKGEVTRAIHGARAPLFGAEHWRPVVVAPSLPRLRHLAVALDHLGVGDLWWGSTFEAVNNLGVLGRAFLNATELARLPRGAVPAFSRSIVGELGLTDGGVG
jgi:hypothetical protein